MINDVAKYDFIIDNGELKGEWKESESNFIDFKNFLNTHNGKRIYLNISKAIQKTGELRQSNREVFKRIFESCLQANCRLTALFVSDHPNAGTCADLTEDESEEIASSLSQFKTLEAVIVGVSSSSASKFMNVLKTLESLRFVMIKQYISHRTCEELISRNLKWINQEPDFNSNVDQQIAALRRSLEEKAREKWSLCPEEQWGVIKNIINEVGLGNVPTLPSSCSEKSIILSHYESLREWNHPSSKELEKF